jgi:hypothetical protein
MARTATRAKAAAKRSTGKTATTKKAAAKAAPAKKSAARQVAAKTAPKAAAPRRGGKTAAPAKAAVRVAAAARAKTPRGKPPAAVKSTRGAKAAAAVKSARGKPAAAVKAARGAKAAAPAKRKVTPRKAATRKAAPPPAAAPTASHRFTVSHLNEADFKVDGLRAYARYRDLGIAEATGGLCQAHVIRLVPPCTDEVRKRHLHHVDLQMVYVLKGWVKNEFEGFGEQMMSAGSCWLQPSGIEHTVLDFSPDCELLEIIVPADFKTAELT